LHEDLKEGDNTSWQQFTLAYMNRDDPGGAYFNINDSNPAAPIVQTGSRTKFLAQYFRYVRQGAVRVDAASSESTFDPVAFVNPDSAMVVVVKTDREGSFAVQGLAPGSYDITATTASAAGQRLGTATVTAEGSLVRVTAPGRGVVTIAGVR
jgi:hypothetical protein